MRSFDRYRKYDKKNIQPNIEKEDLIWDFNVNNNPTSVKFPIFLNDALDENDKQRFERYIRQLGRAILSCSLCDRGVNFFKCGNHVRDPHFQPSIFHNDVAIIKYEPDDNDIYELIDKDLQKILYVTSVIKCYNTIKSPWESNQTCPYFDLETKALSKCWPKLWIVLDEKCADHFGIEWDIGKFQKINDCKYYCCNFKDENYNLIIKAVINPQTRKRLLTS